MRVVACTIGYGAGTGDGFSVAVDGRGIGDIVGTGRVVG